MEWIAGPAAVVLLLVVLDRVLLLAEVRGLIYYRKRQATSGSVSAAMFGPILNLVEPQRQVIVEEQQRQEFMREVAGVDEDE